MLAALVSLRVFTIKFHYDDDRPPGTKSYLPLITKLSSRSPKLEYFAINISYLVISKLTKRNYYGKRVLHGEWVLCDEVEFLSVLRVCMHPFVQRLESVLTIYFLDVWTLRIKGAIYSVRRIINVRRRFRRSKK